MPKQQTKNHPSSKDTTTTTYRLENLSCANCANIFEKNIRKIEGVEDVKVNLGASKLHVTGEHTIADLEKAGSFENIKLREEHESIPVHKPFWKQKETIKVYISAAILFITWFLNILYIPPTALTVTGFILSMFIGGYSLFKTGIKNLFTLTFDMNTLMTIAILGAAVIGEWQEAATVVILFAISEALEEYSMSKARHSIQSLLDIAPKEARIRRGNHEFTVAVKMIRVGDVMCVKPGQKIAMDGVIIKGTSHINQSAITGESNPVFKSSGEEVFAGTLNEESYIEVEVTKLTKDTTLSKIINLVEEAQAEKAPSQKFIDRFASYYTPAILLVAVLIAIIPPLLFGADWNVWIYQGLATLVVGCPCALVLSTPIAIVTAIGSAAKQGVLIKGGVYLEEMSKVNAIAFDKTGTLTKGRPVVTDMLSYSTDGESEWLAVAAAMENGSHHPLANAIINKANNQSIDWRSIEVQESNMVVGKGIKAIINGITYYLGSPTYLKELRPSIHPRIENAIDLLQKEGKTVMILGSETETYLLIAAADEIRENTKGVIQKLHSLGIKETIMLTGDHSGIANTVSESIGVSIAKANLLPADKLLYIQQLKEKNYKVAMIGDGINDAPALASSDIGIAMGGIGTDTALETADIALMSDDLSKLPYLVQLSRKTMKVIKENIYFSLSIKAIALLLVIPGWLTLWIAVFADMGATLLVLLNSLRLLKTHGDIIKEPLNSNCTNNDKKVRNLK